MACPQIEEDTGGGMITDWRMLWTEEPGATVHRVEKVEMAEAHWAHTHSIWSKIIAKKKRVDWNGNETKLYHYLIFFPLSIKKAD